MSFKEDEIDLLNAIEERSKHITQSGWMKLAAAEKIEREENHSTYREPPAIDGLDSFLDSM